METLLSGSIKTKHKPSVVHLLYTWTGHRDAACYWLTQTWPLQRGKTVQTLPPGGSTGPFGHRSRRSSPIRNKTSLWSLLQIPECRWHCHMCWPQGRRWRWGGDWLGTRSVSEGYSTPPGILKGNKQTRLTWNSSVAKLYLSNVPE